MLAPKAAQRKWKSMLSRYHEEAHRSLTVGVQAASSRARKHAQSLGFLGHEPSQSLSVGMDSLWSYETRRRSKKRGQR
jgi:hypothetical protein